MAVTKKEVAEAVDRLSIEAVEAHKYLNLMKVPTHTETGDEEIGRVRLSIVGRIRAAGLTDTMEKNDGSDSSIG